MINRLWSQGAPQHEALGVRKRRRKQRGRTLGADVDDALRVIDDTFDHIAAERQTPNLMWMATHPVIALFRHRHQVRS